MTQLSALVAGCSRARPWLSDGTRAGKLQWEEVSHIRVTVCVLTERLLLENHENGVDQLPIFAVETCKTRMLCPDPCTLTSSS